MSIVTVRLTISHGYAVSRRRAALLLRGAHKAVALLPAPQMVHTPQILSDALLISELGRKIQKLQNVSLNLISQAQSANSPSVVTQRTYSEEELSALYEDLAEPTQHISNVSDTHSELQASDAVLAAYASAGDVGGFELCMNNVLSGQHPTETQRDLHIKAHLVNSAATFKISETGVAFPTRALEILHQYEASGHPAPIKSYTRAICTLFSVRTSPSSSLGLGRSAAHSQAWDLFAHMRYVAHPTPDAHLYAIMIRACGMPTRPEPERALDLWTEMLENRIQPTKGAYEAIILVCGRAGQKWLGEGIRLAREMNTYLPGVSGGRQMWCALLEGCKRIGDLKRARWILADALRSAVQGDIDKTSSVTSTVDAKMMSHLFHTYASYTPPFKRGATRLVEEHSSETTEPSLTQSDSTTELQDPDHTMDDINPSFSRLPPQTASDVIAEAQALFDRIVQDRDGSLEQARSRRTCDPLAGKFAQVESTPSLLNAYMSVFYAHARIERAREVFSSLFGTTGQSHYKSNAHTFVDALERCSLATKNERVVASQWGQELWLRWQAIESQAVTSGHDTVGPFARLIERAHTAMRRILTLTGNLDGALALLREFVSRYPPSAIPLVDRLSEPNPSLVTPALIETSSAVKPINPRSLTPTLFAKPPILSTRTALVNPKSSSQSSLSVARPLVRLTSPIGPRDDRVPPLVSFADIELLHHRLANRRRAKDLAYLKWLCNAYGGALRKRRGVVLKAVPQEHRHDGTEHE